MRVRQFEGEVLYSYGKHSEDWGDELTNFEPWDGNYVDYNSNGYMELVAPNSLCITTYTKPIDFSNYKNIYLVVNKQLSTDVLRACIKKNYPIRVNDDSDYIARPNPELLYNDNGTVIYKLNVEDVTKSGYFTISAFNGANDGLRIYEVYLEK